MKDQEKDVNVMTPETIIDTKPLNEDKTIMNTPQRDSIVDPKPPNEEKGITNTTPRASTATSTLSNAIQTPLTPAFANITVTRDMIVVALADYDAESDEQLTLKEGEKYIRITEDFGNGWSFGSTLDGTITGVFPQTYVDPENQQN
jgi:hypothetical protein